MYTYKYLGLNLFDGCPLNPIPVGRQIGVTIIVGSERKVPTKVPNLGSEIKVPINGPD
jgi:hypothetical protein